MSIIAWVINYLLYSNIYIIFSIYIIIYIYIGTDRSYVDTSQVIRCIELVMEKNHAKLTRLFIENCC